MSQTEITKLTRQFNKAELAQEVFKLRGQVKKEGGQDPNIAAADERAGQEALANVTAQSPEQAAASLTALGVGINSTIQQVASEIIQGRNTLNDLTKACDAKEGELTNLFGQEVVARSLGSALADHDGKRKEFKAKEEELAEELQRAQDAGERQKQEWQRQFTADCERERSGFNYQFSTEQRDARDGLAVALKTERGTFDDAQRIAQRNATEAEAELQKRILAVAEQEAEAEAIEEKLKAKFNQEKNAATGNMKREHEHEMAIRTNNAQTAAAISASTITTANEQLVKQQTEIEQLKAQLTAAQVENTELAKSALESASGRFALDQVMRQGDNNGGTTRPRGKA